MNEKTKSVTHVPAQVLPMSPAFTWNAVPAPVHRNSGGPQTAAVFKKRVSEADQPPISVRPESEAPSSIENTLDLMSPLMRDLSFSSQRWDVILPSTLP